MDIVTYRAAVAAKKNKNSSYPGQILYQNYCLTYIEDYPKQNVPGSNTYLALTSESGFTAS